MKKKEWTDADAEIPPRNKWFDICELDLGDEFIAGWWSGTEWDGRKYKGQKVKRWKYLGTSQEI